MPSDDLVLSVKNLKFWTPGGRTLAEGVSFDLRSGEILFVTGPNGAGKSTLLRALLGRWKYVTGEVNWGIPLSQIAWVPQSQNTAVHWNLSLRDVLGSELKKEDGELLKQDQLGLNWNSASGGERKRTLLLRALKQSPSALLLDEPLNHLDRGSKTTVAQTLAQYLAPNAKEKRAILLISHEEFIDSDLARFRHHQLRIEGGSHA